MAYFAQSDSLRILRYLKLPASYLPSLQSQQAFIYSKLGDAVVTEVVAILDELDNLDLVKATLGSDASGNLRAADSLQWFSPSEGGRLGLTNDRYNELKNRLATTLDMKMGGANSFQGTPQLRS